MQLSVSAFLGRGWDANDYQAHTNYWTWYSRSHEQHLISFLPRLPPDPKKKILYPQVYQQRNQSAEMLPQRWLSHFRAGLCFKKSHGQVHRKCTVHLFALGLKRILSRIQQTSLVSLKYIELESVRGCCHPSQYFRIPWLGIFLLHC